MANPMQWLFQPRNPPQLCGNSPDPSFGLALSIQVERPARPSTATAHAFGFIDTRAYSTLEAD